jgi:hypothetical protein
MSYLGYDKIAVKGIAGLKHIEQLELDIAPNQHAKLKVTGLLNSESEVRYLEENLEDKTIQLVTTDDGEKTVFAGRISVAHVTENRGVFQFKAEALSGTMLLDQEKHSRSFQNTNLTYPQVVNQVIKDVPHCVANFQIGQDVKIGVPLIQYLEKDWDYIKRMASHFGAVVVPEATSGRPHFWFGMPQGENHTLSQIAEYKVWKDFGRFNEMGGKAAGYQVNDFLGCEVRTGAEFDIGDRVAFQDRVWFVGSKKGRMEKGLWVYTYGLGFKSALGLKKRYNKIISGMSLQGKVLETKEERLKVHLDIDKNQDQSTAYWIPGCRLRGI